MKKLPSLTREKKKMSLSKETLRFMTSLELQQVVGATGECAPTADCTREC